MKLPATFKAFTLLEMLAGMTIAAMVVLLGFYGIQLTMQQYHLFKKNTDIAENCRHVEALLWRDFTAARQVLRAGENHINCELDSASCRYTFYPEFIIRSQEQQAQLTNDTIFLINQHLETTLNNLPQTDGRIDACSIELVPYGEPLMVEIKKIYSVAESSQESK